MIYCRGQRTCHKSVVWNRISENTSKNRLWTKGEESGNFLEVKSIAIDCDNDTILIKAKPFGPTCHTGSTTCFNEVSNRGFVYELEQTINDRIDLADDKDSYT